MRALDDLRARLAAWRLRLDPTTRRWVEEVRRSMADGSFEERCASQPTPAEIVARSSAAKRLASSEQALQAAVTGMPTYWRDPETGTTWKIERMPDLVRETFSPKDSR